MLAGVDLLFQSLLLPGDTITLVTPMKPYSLAPDALARKSKAALSKEMQKILRKDIQQGGGDYRDTLRDLRRVVRAIGGDRQIPEGLDENVPVAAVRELHEHVPLHGLDDVADEVEPVPVLLFGEVLHGEPGLGQLAIFFMADGPFGARP